MPKEQLAVQAPYEDEWLPLPEDPSKGAMAAGTRQRKWRQLLAVGVVLVVIVGTVIATRLTSASPTVMPTTAEGSPAAPSAELWQVWTTGRDTVLPVHAAPGESSSVLLTLLWNEQVNPYPGPRNVGGITWIAVKNKLGTVGWVDLAQLRPVGNPVTIVGTQMTNELSEAAASVVQAFHYSDWAALAARVDPARGLYLVTRNVTAGQLKAASGDTSSYDWSDPASTVAVPPQRGTIVQQLTAVAGTYGLTSYNKVGFGEHWTGANGFPTDRGRALFPQATFVDYYYGGSEIMARKDWFTVRLGFDSTSGSPRLVAVLYDFPQS